MPSFEFTSPEGKKYTVDGPEGATKEQAFQVLQQQIATGTAKPTEAPADTKPHSLIDTLAAIPGQVKEAITGDQRHTAETDALPDWAGMPELNSFSLASAKTGLGTLLSNPQETVQIIKSNFPGVQVKQDDKGNYLLRSSIDGKDYAIKPGFQVSDIPRAAGAVAAFTPAGRATSILGAGAAAAGTQAIIEASQAATGGEFNKGEVAMAGGMGAAVPAVVNAARAVVQPAKTILNRVRGTPDPVATAIETPAAAPANPLAAVPEAPATAEVAPAAAAAAPEAVVPNAATMPAADLAQTARKAAEGGIFGGNRATKVLAEQAAPDAKVVDAAKRLGIEDYLQPDHVTTNQAYRELAQAVKSIPGSEARAAELTGLEQVAQRADKLIEDIGGTHDVSTLNTNVKRTLQDSHDQLFKKAGALYDEIRATIPAKSEAPADNVLAMIKGRADDLGGVKNLSPMEKMILSKLSPAKETIKEVIPGLPGGQPARVRSVQVERAPNYALLDDVRRDLTAAKYKSQGPFKDSDERLITMLEGALRKDQEAAAASHGMADTWNLAQATSQTYKGIQDDLRALFGKNLDESLVGDLSRAVKSLPAGDPSNFIRLVKAIPEGMRQDVTASGLNTAFGKSARNGQLNFSTYANWYEGLLRNKQAHTALMANLPLSARKQLSDLYRVSRGISSATRERITTGRINAVKDELKPAENLMGRLYDAARRSSTAVAVGTVVGHVPVIGPAMQIAITSALTTGAKSNAIKAVDSLITSHEFTQLAKQAGKPGEKAATLRLVHSKNFTRFVHAVGKPRELGNREKWVLQAMQAQNQQQR
jgi:hypothetical protein